MDEDSEPTTLLSLPSELVRHIMGSATASSVCSAGGACKALAAHALDETVWRAVYQRRWSHDLLAPDEPCTCSWRNIYRFRDEDRHGLCIVEGVHGFTGTITDAFDGSIGHPSYVMPIEATISIHLNDNVLTGGRQIKGRGILRGHVRCAEGFFRRAPTTCSWFGITGSSELNTLEDDTPVEDVNVIRHRVMWREEMQGHPGRRYEGTLDKDGLGISGTYEVIDPYQQMAHEFTGKRGTFKLRRRELIEGEPATIKEHAFMMIGERLRVSGV